MMQLREKRLSRSMKALLVGLLLAALLAGLLAVRPAHADGGTIVVNSTGDEDDAQPGDGRCDTLNDGSLTCTLRAAISEANQRSGFDLIDFNIPASGVHTIKPGSSLPVINGQVTIDGYSQPGASENTLEGSDDASIEIELDGSGAGSGVSGLNINFNGDGSEIKGLAINGFSNHGINIDSANGVKVEGNFIGTDPLSGRAKPNTNDGVRILGLNDSAFGNTVGGTTPAARNVISGNFGAGVEIRDPLHTGKADANVVEGNFIGTDRHTGPLANGNSGVLIRASSRNFIGSTTPGAANTIAFNSVDGVNVQEDQGDATSNRVITNSIFSNGALGVDLGGDGITPNDQGDADTGANNLQNFPVLASAKIAKGKTTVKGTLNSVPLKDYRVEFFANPEADSSGAGEGTFLGEKSVTTDANGNAGFSFTAPTAVPVGNFVSATATPTVTSGGFVIPSDTSEFSKPVKVKKHKKHHH